MAADYVTLRGRAAAESIMTATGVIRRATGATTTDPETLEEIPVMEDIYAGACRLRIVKSVQGSEGAIPGAVAVKDELILSIPVDAPGSGNVRPNDIWTCVTNPLDPSTIGLEMRISGAHHGTYMTARRFPVEEIN